MKLPEKKRNQLEKKGKHESPPVRGGGAMGRLRQFEKERGLSDTDLANPADDEATEKESDQSSDKCS
jgi:hypothetical protein